MNVNVALAPIMMAQFVSSPPPVPSPEQEACTIWCYGPILTAVQSFNLFPDSKTFVDMPLKDSITPAEALATFHQLQKPTTKEILQRFVNATFLAAGSDLVLWQPPDWTERLSPGLDKIANETRRNFTSSLNKLWRVLGREPSPSVASNPEKHSLLPTKEGLIVPGGRFRESYYWDTFWIIKGLLVCSMVDTAKGLVDNLLAFADKYGHVPNGGRVYYLDRSQPPLLSEMVRVVYTAMLPPSSSVNTYSNHGTSSTAATAWLAKATQILIKEQVFWRQNRTKVLRSLSSTTTAYSLSHYGQFRQDRSSSSSSGSSSNNTTDELPRPESWREDIATAAAAATAHGRDASDVYRELVAGAETGWDFSSRWFADGKTITTINTTSVMPVELNCILLRAELNLYFTQTVLRDAAGASAALHAAKRRYAAMEVLMWSEEGGRWVDVDSKTGYQIPGRPTSASDFLPLWAFTIPDSISLLNPNTTRLLKAAAAFNASGLVGAAGVRTTTVETNQQWDNPNAWAPLVDMLVEGLLRLPDLVLSSGSESEEVASAAALLAEVGTRIANRWLETNLVAWQKSGFMYEKYNADEIGVGGGGGEYTPQLGFGWSNGVALSLIERFWQ